MLYKEQYRPSATRREAVYQNDWKQEVAEYNRITLVFKIKSYVAKMICLSTIN